MKKLRGYLFILLGYGTILQAQVSVGASSTFSASPYDNPAYAGAGGSPYIPLAFQKMLATRMTGETDTLMARLDTYGDYLEILRKDKKVLISKNQYRQLVMEIDDSGVCLFKNDFKNPDWANDYAFYQVLYDGKTKLLKHTYQTLRDCYEYGGVYRQCFRKQEKIYLQVGTDKLVQIDNDREKIWELLKDAPTLKEYANQQKWKLKRWADVVSVLQYYDTQKATSK